MKRLVLFICTLLCTNILLAQSDAFLIGQLYYHINYYNGNAVVYGYDFNNPPTDLVIPSTVTYYGTTYDVVGIDYAAFFYVYNGSMWVEMPCVSLTSVTIPNSVTDIEASAFSGCSNLVSVTIPDSVIYIKSSTFSGCSSLTSITIPNSVTYIGNNAFTDCSSLTSVTIPNSVTSIEDGVFSGCSSLTSVNIPNSIASIGQYAFYGCSSLTSVTIPNSVTSIGYEAFRNCSSLTSMTIEMNNIPNISNIGGLNSSLQNLTLGENVTSITSGAFSGCSFLQNVTCLATTPPTLADNTVFPYPNIATLTVPCGTLEAYSAPTSFWNMFFMGRISENGYNVVATANDNAFGSVAVANDCSTATLTATANEGYVFLSWNDGNTENPRLVSLTSDTSFVANFIISTINTEIAATICQGQTYTENGFNVSESGVYTQNLTASNGADSIVTLTLNVLPIFNTELTATICEGQVYTENNFNVSEAGVYTQTLTAVNGCDSIVTLTLNILPSYNTNLTATICQGSELNISGFNVSEAGVYTQNLTSVNGCDSIVTLTVTELPIIHTDLTLTICEGTSLNLSGFNVSEAGVYTQTHTAVNGCDSIVTLTVTELPTIHTDLTLTICEGTSLNFSGFNVSEAGVYTQTHTSVNGCDSIVTLTVSVNPTFDTTINATINAGETYAEFGFNESEAGTYVQNLQTVNGCDSTITLILDVNSSLMDVEDTELSFYPNPTDSKVIFSQMIEKIEVIDLTGKVIFTLRNESEINVESLPAGAYYLRLTNNDKAVLRKLIKE